MSEYIVEYLPDTTCIEREEIVRCRNCGYCVNHESYLACGYFDSDYAEIEPGGFCAWGEKRESNKV